MNEIFKAYDIRGVYPSQLDEDIAFSLGRALADFLNVSSICIGRDMRLSSPNLKESLIAGIMNQGVSVIDLGLTSTDMVYFATGKFSYGAGVMITASHNPGEWNGFKICKEKAAPLSCDNGLFKIRDKVKNQNFIEVERKGEYQKKEVMSDWIDFALSFVDLEKIRPLKIAVDAGNGMAGLVMPELIKKMPQIEIVPMFMELDGSFPNHLASPIEPCNTKDLREKVVKEKCDLGLAFDGDADRVFFVDNEGETLSGTITTAMISEIILKKNNGGTILYNAICGKIVPEIIEKNNGKAYKTRVGHSFIKAKMKEHNALFAGEHSGHYYFKENYNADSALITTLILLELICSKNKSLAELKKEYTKYVASPEINSKVLDIPRKLEELKENYKDANEIDDLDGLSFYYNDFWFNVRPSNTEPLLRLNVEADNEEILEEKVEEILGIIRGKG